MSPRRLLSLSSVTGWTARITFLGCLLTMALLFTTYSEASVTLRVDETRTRILLEHQPATVLLPVENLSSTPLQTRIHLELLDQTDRVVAQTDQAENVSGKQTLSLPIPFEIANLKTPERRFGDFLCAISVFSLPRRGNLGPPF